MSKLRVLILFAAVAAFAPLQVHADEIDDGPTGAPPVRRQAPPPPAPPPPPPARKPPPPPPPPAAKPKPAPAPMAQDLWSFSIAGWYTIMAIDGDSTIDAIPFNIDMDLGNAFGGPDSNGGGGRLEAWRDRIGAFVEVNFQDWDGGDWSQIKGSTFDVDYDLERLNVDFGLSYKVVNHELGDGRFATLEPIVGGRWIKIKQRASAGLGPPFRASNSDDYWEPFLGARTVVDLTDRLSFRIGGDVGGFGAGSDLSWHALGEFGFDVTGPLELRLGYGAEGIDWETGGGSHSLDTVAHGPRFGLALNF